jgi:glycine/D-amino acid oxidase-like deaminating enzyme
MCNNGFAQDYGMLSAQARQGRREPALPGFDAGVDTGRAPGGEEKIDCSFARVGKIKLAAKPEHYDKLARSQELLAANVEPDTAMVSRAELASEVGSDRYHGGLIFRKGAGMHVGRFVRGLAEAAARRGVEIHEHTPMTGLRPAAGGGHQVERRKAGCTPSRCFWRAEPRNRAAGLDPAPIVPVGAFLIVTEPLPTATLDRLLPKRRMAVDTRTWSTTSAPRPTPAAVRGRARFAVSNPASDEKSGAILPRCTARCFPELRSARIDYCWGGMVDMTRDRLPRAGERNGIYYSMGYSGHGTQMSTLMGTIMAEVMDGRTELNPWKTSPGPPFRAISVLPGSFRWSAPITGSRIASNDLGRSTPDGSRLPRQILHRRRMAEADGSATAVVVNPATEQPIAEVALGNEEDVEYAVAAARRAFAGWSCKPAAERAGAARPDPWFAPQRLGLFAQAITSEMGAAITYARRAQVPLAAEHIRVARDNLATYSFITPRGSTAIMREAIGVCGLITPWNWPLYQITAKVGPALAAGCTVVLKPSELSPLSALLFAEVMDDAGCPPGVFNLVNGTGPVVGTGLASHPQVDMISITARPGPGFSLRKRRRPPSSASPRNSAASRRTSFCRMPS